MSFSSNLSRTALVCAFNDCNAAKCATATSGSRHKEGGEEAEEGEGDGGARECGGCSFWYWCPDAARPSAAAVARLSTAISFAGSWNILLKSVSMPADLGGGGVKEHVECKEVTIIFHFKVAGCSKVRLA